MVAAAVLIGAAHSPAPRRRRSRSSPTAPRRLTVPTTKPRWPSSRGARAVRGEPRALVSFTILPQRDVANDARAAASTRSRRATDQLLIDKTSRSGGSQVQQKIAADFDAESRQVRVAREMYLSDQAKYRTPERSASPSS
jgi:hypothetical protein